MSFNELELKRIDRTVTSCATARLVLSTLTSCVLSARSMATPSLSGKCDPRGTV